MRVGQAVTSAPSTRTPVRLSKNVRLVLDVVCAQGPGEHAAAHDIHRLARRRQPAVGVSTVYRALERLCAVGLLHAVRMPGEATTLYEPARHAHAHFRCRACRRVDDIDYDLPTDDIARLDTEHGVAISGVMLTFNGLCAACRDKGPSPDRGV